jgi:hypothetical protein
MVSPLSTNFRAWQICDAVSLRRSITPEILEPIGSKFGVSGRVLDILVPEVVLQ